MIASSSPTLKRITPWLAASLIVAIVAVGAHFLNAQKSSSKSLEQLNWPTLAKLSLSGNVRGETGEAVSSATICAYGAFAAKLDRHCTGADAEGAYQLDLVVGEYSVTVSAADYASATASLVIEESKQAHLDFTMTRQAPTIAGVVRSATGELINDAKLVIYQGDQLVSNVVTNNLGRFSAWTPLSALLVRIDAEGFATAVVEVVAPTTDVTITLYPGNVVTGRVLLDGSRQPVPNVHVSAVSRTDRVISPLRDNAVVTNERGEFVFRDLPNGVWMLAVSDRHVWGSLAQPLVVQNGRAEGDITLLVQPAVEVVGQFVVGERSEPCLAGRLHLTPEALMSREASSPLPTQMPSEMDGRSEKSTIPVFTTLVEKNGTVRFDAIPYGVYRVGPICNEHELVAGPASLEIGESGKSKLQWKFQTGVGIEARVIDEGGRPIAKADIWMEPLSDASLSQTQRMMSQRKGTTNEAGQYRFGGLTRARYRLSARYGGVNGNAIASEIVDLQSGSAPSPVTLTLPGVGSIQVRARNARGEAVSRLLFFAIDSAGARYEGSYRGNGQFLIGPLPRDRYSIFGYDNKNAKISVNGGQPVWVAGIDPITIDVNYEPPTGRLDGRVTDSRGEPQSGVYVRAVSVTLDENDEKYSIIQASAHGGQELITDHNGLFRIEGLEAQAQYDLYIDHPSGAKDVRRSVSPGTFVDVALPGTAVVVGRVVDAQGKPAVNFDVLAYHKGSHDGYSKSFTSKDGSFKMDQVYPGELEIAVYADDDTKAFREIRISQGESIDIGVLKLDRIAPKGSMNANE